MIGAGLRHGHGLIEGVRGDARGGHSRVAAGVIHELYTAVDTLFFVIA